MSMHLGGLPDSQAHQCHAQCNPSEESHRDEGFQAHGGTGFFFHAGFLILDHVSSPKSARAVTYRRNHQIAKIMPLVRDEVDPVKY